MLCILRASKSAALTVLQAILMARGVYFCNHSVNDVSSITLSSSMCFLMVQTSRIGI